MITEDQSRVLAFLGASATHAGMPVERIDTHTSVVFLAGQRAFKLKRAVRYDYLDYATAEQRRQMCEDEVRLNRRTAPGLYRGVVGITETPDGALQLGGSGRPVDWVVEMIRFDQGCLLDQLAGHERLPLDLMRPLAVAIAQFHSQASARLDFGGWEAMVRVINGNAAGLVQDGAGILDPAPCARLTRLTRFALDLAANLLDSRRDDGQVRQCHGDLHLRNVVLLDGRPTLFDAIEFNDDIACIDVLYDLAFLLMDLWRRGLRPHANAVWNGYLAETRDFEGLPLMPLFLSCRAGVAAKTTATAATMQTDRGQRTHLSELAAEYLRWATSFLQEPAARLIAIGGFSGSGKSTLAQALAPFIGTVPGAVVIRSDEIRKQLSGVKALQQLGPEGYTDTMTRRVYAAMLERADVIVRSGYAAVVDAVFARQPDREAVQHVAAAAGVPFTGLWLDAPEPVLTARVQSRVADPSDADVRVVRHQLARDSGDVSWHRLDASQSPAHVLQAASAVVAPVAWESVR